MAEMVFVLVVSGFVISEIWSEWDVTDKFIGYLPDMVINSLAVINKFLVGFIKGSITFAIIPLIIWFIPFLISKIMGTTLKIKDYFLNYGIAFIPIIAAAHLDKSILKSTSRIPYFNHLFDDVTGMTTAQRIIEKEIIIQQTPLWLNVGISILMTAIISVGIYLSYKIIRLQNKKQGFEKSVKSTYLIPILYGSIFLVMILIWRWNM